MASNDFAETPESPKLQGPPALIDTTPSSYSKQHKTVAPSTSLENASAQPVITPRVAFIDVIPSSLFITPQVEQNIRECVKKIADSLATEDGGPHITVSFPQCASQESRKDRRSSEAVHSQVYNNPLWYKYLPPFNVHVKPSNGDAMDSCTPFVRSWQSTLKLKRVYEALRARTASIPKLPMGLFGITNTPHAATAAVESDATPVPLHIRLGVPTLDSACDNLLATPPSLAWALAVTMEFYRLQAEYGMSSNLETNLTVETVGVLENWIEFFTYGSLLTDGSMKSTFIDKAWEYTMQRFTELSVEEHPQSGESEDTQKYSGDGDEEGFNGELQPNSTSTSQRINCSPPTVTIVIDSDMDYDEGIADPVEECTSDQFATVNYAWRNAVSTRVSQGSAVLLKGKNAETCVTEAILNKITTLCNNTLAPKPENGDENITREATVSAHD